MSLRHAVLGLLSQEPGSGWDLMQRFEVSLVNVWQATQSQLYGELGKLADAGLISVVAEGPRGRKEYAITDAGREELRHWMLDFTLRVQRDDVLLRVFFLNALEPEQARAFLAASAERSGERHEQLAKLHEQIDWNDNALSVYGALALEFGLRYTEMRREWAEWALSRLPEK